MKSLVYMGAEHTEIKELPVPITREGQVRIRVIYCGICGSDIGIYSGKHPRAKAPLVLGHEFIGIIDEINGGSGRFKIGDRVAAYPLLSCGNCFACRTGIPHVCRSLKLIGIDVDGGIAEYVVCNEDVLFKLDAEISNKAAAVIEPLAVILHSMHRVGVQVRDTAAIIGAGPIGILTGIVLKHMGISRIFISDINESRLELCRKIGLDAINAKSINVTDYVCRETEGVGADVVFECSGAEAAALEMTELCRIGGTICMTGVHKIPHPVNLQNLNFKEQTMIGSRVYTLREFGQAVKYAKEIAPELEQIVTHIIPLNDAENVFDLIGNPAEMTAKVIIDCQ